MLVSFFQFRAGPTFTLELFRVALLAVLQAKGCGEAPLSEPERAPALVFLEVAEFDPVLNPAFGFAQRSKRVVEKPAEIARTEPDEPFGNVFRRTGCRVLELVPEATIAHRLPAGFEQGEHFGFERVRQLPRGKLLDFLDSRHRHLTVHGVCLVANLLLGRDS
jgi:hypothetical protein